VLFPTYGWLAFEPTPTRFNDVAAPYAFPLPAGTGSGRTAPPALCEHPVQRGIDFAEACLGSTRSPNVRPGAAATDPAPSKASGETVTTRHGRRPGTLLWAGVLALVVLILVGIPATKASRRRLVLARAKAPADRVLAAFRTLADQAADVGLGRMPAETLREYAGRLVQSVQGLDGVMEGLSGLAGRAAYSENSLSVDQADEARSAARLAARVIRRSVGVQRRVLGWLRVRGALLLR
jgi:uncharacterized protein DUF4129